MVTFTPDFASASASASAVVSAPDAKLSLNITAFNGNTTNFNRCAAPNPKASALPMQVFVHRPSTLLPM